MRCARAGSRCRRIEVVEPRDPGPAVATPAPSGAEDGGAPTTSDSASTGASTSPASTDPPAADPPAADPPPVPSEAPSSLAELADRLAAEADGIQRELD